MTTRTPGLVRRGNIWHMKKTVCGVQISGSCHTSYREQAERVLSQRVDEVYRTKMLGECPKITFSEAALRYIGEKQAKKSIKRDIECLNRVMPYIGHLDIRDVHMGTLADYIAKRQSEVNSQTVNRELASVRQVLTRAGRVWRHENNRPFVDAVPLIEMLPTRPRKPVQLTWDEQKAFERALPAKYARYMLFLVNTGLRCQEGLQLRWDWELRGHQAFMVPGEFHKNGQSRVVACNSIAWSVTETQKGRDRERVFPITPNAFRMAWDKARKELGLEHIRRHDLKHTFGMRLRSAGVEFSDRQDLLGHKSSRITDHYSAPDIARLVEASERVVGMTGEPALRCITRR